MELSLHLERLNPQRLTRMYEDEKGSPLKIYLHELVDKLQAKYNDDVDVYGANAYQNPGLPEVMGEIEKKAYAQVIVLPLYAQYASSTTGSTAQKVMEIMSKWEVIPSVNFINEFCFREAYINAVVETAKYQYDFSEFDKVVFSYHGVPVRHIKKSCKVPGCEKKGCISEYSNERMYCYRSACYETTRQIVARIGIPEEK